jgi:hypothetical protein
MIQWNNNEAFLSLERAMLTCTGQITNQLYPAVNMHIIDKDIQCSYICSYDILKANNMVKFVGKFKDNDFDFSLSEWTSCQPSDILAGGVDTKSSSQVKISCQAIILGWSKPSMMSYLFIRYA